MSNFEKALGGLVEDLIDKGAQGVKDFVQGLQEAQSPAPKDSENELRLQIQELHEEILDKDAEIEHLRKSPLVSEEQQALERRCSEYSGKIQWLEAQIRDKVNELNNDYADLVEKLRSDLTRSECTRVDLEKEVADLEKELQAIYPPVKSINKCKNCHGSGKVHKSDDRYSQWTETCKVCEGQG